MTTQTQNKKAMCAKVPVLRFPEFSGEWEEKKLGEVSGRGMYGMNSSAVTFDGVHKYIRITDIDEDSRRFIPSPLTSPDGEFEDAYKLKRGDLLFTRTGASTGKSYLYDENDGEVYFAGFLIKFSIDKANPYFVFSQTLRGKYNKWVKAVSMRSGQPGINAEEYQSLKMFFPSKEEQQKIAGFLGAVDEKIEGLSKKKESLERYKKGVMQKIFSQEIRFKDENGNSYPDWEEKSIGDIFSFKKTNSLSRSLLSYESGKIKNIHYGDIHTKYRSSFDVTKENVPFVNSDISCDEDDFCQEGDLVIADASEDYKDIGKAIEIVNLNNEKVVAGLHTMLARDENHLIAKGFFGYLMRVWNVRLQVMKLSAGISVLGISKNNLSRVKIALPSKKEQQKIADFLTSLDGKISAIGNELSRAKEFKKGLLQQMFV